MKRRVWELRLRTSSFSYFFWLSSTRANFQLVQFLLDKLPCSKSGMAWWPLITPGYDSFIGMQTKKCSCQLNYIGLARNSSSTVLSTVPLLISNWWREGHNSTSLPVKTRHQKLNRCVAVVDGIVTHPALLHEAPIRAGPLQSLLSPCGELSSMYALNCLARFKTRSGTIVWGFSDGVFH